MLQTKFQFASLQTLLPAFLVLTLFPSPARAFPPQDQQSAVAQSAPNYPNSDDGFRDQFKAVFQAECPGGSAPGKHLLEQFKIPDSAAWFARNFDPSDAPTLAERYDRLFPDYVNSVVDTIKRVCDDKGLVYVTGSKDRPAEPTSIRPGFKLSAIHPRQELSPLMFEFALQKEGRDVAYWGEVFVYDQGAFRYVGPGGWPFWIWEEGAGPVPSKFHGSTPPPVLIHQIPPDYPPAARNLHIEGTVELLVIVNTDGTVKRAGVVHGDPALVDAAKKAVMKWRYKPSTIDGKPVEGATTAKLTFQLGNH